MNIALSQKGVALQLLEFFRHSRVPPRQHQQFKQLWQAGQEFRLHPRVPECCTVVIWPCWDFWSGVFLAHQFQPRKKSTFALRFPPILTILRIDGRSNCQTTDNFDLWCKNPLDGGLDHVLFVHSVGNVIIPTDELILIFFRGVGQPPTSIS